MIDVIKCGRVIIFNSILKKNRWAFCIDYDLNSQVVYHGLFGLKAVDKKTFLGFARIVDVFDYIDRDLTQDEITKLKQVHKTGIMKSCVDVREYVDDLFRFAKIKLFINSEDSLHANIIKR